MIATVYSGYDNVITATLYDGDAPADISGATKIELALSDTESVNSVDNPDLFDLSSAAVGRFTVTLGGQGWPVGTHAVRIVTTDNDHLNGLVWCHEDDELAVCLAIV